MSVADWESAEPDGLPVLDLVYFLVHGALILDGSLDRRSPAPTYEAALDPNTSIGTVVAQCEASYCDRVGVDPSLVPALRLLCWTIHAESEFGALSRETGGAPPPEMLARARFLQLWRTELRLQSMAARI